MWLWQLELRKSFISVDETGDGLCSCDCCGGNVWIWNEDLSEIEEFMVFSYLCAVILYQNMLKYPLLISHSTHPEDAGKATGISRFRVKILRHERQRRVLWIYKTERRPAVTDTMRVY